MSANSALVLGAGISATPTTVFTWPGGVGMFSAEATWGGGTVSLEFKTPNGTWIAVGADTTLTANGGAGFLLPAGTAIRAAVTTATAVYAYAVGMS